MMKARVLIIDDEEMICSMLRDIFIDRGATVTTALTAADALHLIAAEAHAFDLLLVDKNLPGGMSGVELIRQVREADEDVSIIMMTGYASAESIVETLNLGIDSYVEKPFPSLDELVTLAEAIVDRHHAAELARRPIPERMLEAIAAIKPGRTELSDLTGVFARVRSRITVVDSDAALLTRIVPAPDVIVLDSDLWEGGQPAVVRMVHGMAPDAVCVVLSNGTLSTTVLKQLVDLGVSALYDWSTDPDWRRKLEVMARKILG